jgi:hypothetical protein
VLRSPSVASAGAASMVKHVHVAFSVLDATDWDLRGLEQRGVTQHPWLLNPDDGQLYLWKPATGRRLERREHWAEKAASEVAHLLGIPCAQVELAERAGVAGCLSRNLLTEDLEIHAGAFLLTEVDPSFDPTDKGHSAYTVANVARVLRDVEPPQSAVLPSLPDGTTGFDVFAGFLMFDALVLNRDRHAANWSILRPREGNGPDRLCPLYDNASALALSLSDASMSKRVSSRGVQAYADRENYARAFAHPNGRIRTVYEIAAEALATCRPAARDLWCGRLRAVDEVQIADVVHAVAGMSETARTFTVELVMCTRRRLVDVCG